MKTRWLLPALLLASAPAFAADIDGTWAGKIDSPDGSAVEVKFTFKADKDKLSGSAIGPDGTALPISDGKIAGNTATFSLSVDMGQGPMAIGYKGEVEKEKITMSMSFMEQPIPIALVLTKAVDKPTTAPAAKP